MGPRTLCVGFKWAVGQLQSASSLLQSPKRVSSVSFSCKNNALTCFKSNNLEKKYLCQLLSSPTTVSRLSESKNRVARATGSKNNASRHAGSQNRIPRLTGLENNVPHALRGLGHTKNPRFAPFEGPEHTRNHLLRASGKQVTRSSTPDCTEHLPSQLRFFLSMRFQVQLTDICS